MVRSALAPGRRLNQGPRQGADYVPAISVGAASLLALLPLVTATGWFPDTGFLVLLAWRLQRADSWPAWWAAPLGLWNDLVTGTPIGFSIVLWTATMLVMDIVDRRTMWRDYWIEWALAALLIAASELMQWQIAAILGAAVPVAFVVGPVLVAVFCFPLAAYLVHRLDRWRLGR